MIRDSEHGDKKSLRKQWTGMRDAMSARDRKLWSEAACEKLSEWVEDRECRSVMVYSSFRSELDLRAFIERCWSRRVGVIVPRSIPSDYSMKLYAFAGWDELIPGAYGIMEPDPARMAELPAEAVPDIVVVPGLAFDREGGRMGYGAGYYDRYAEQANRQAAELGKKILWIGAGFEAQLVERVPLEEHDLRLDGVVTEKALYFRHDPDGD
ncbi:5-formyltetrahydrofolate cyclo-ligase [Paenibacillus soyae]|uniref:5-formyltetrahydrofolate cyclo-ligase n=1 Tax=Paenibacillus soyae TaxID=2969249 RepID=A0A9X2S7K8_9BACL|nr:5-formyltetrahydrofolate cyclo-ligase [Paenibacillus soyae]MCR2803434.1 5-formyltetrahydrofolate cyclo-ligase [Paenibacillus soyae]